VDLARALAPDVELEVVGIRPGEKLHEALINKDDARRTVDLGSHYVVEPDMDWWSGHSVGGEPVQEDFSYTSDNNRKFLSVEQIRDFTGENA
jgi:UDP-N-acetylglucosamine 4,6-dehydratase